MTEQNHLSILERWFHLTEHDTTVKTEMLAGLTTFLTMAYIIFVQPAVLSACGMDFGAVLVATCLSSALATLLDKYRDLPMSLADACLVRMAEKTTDSVVLTLDSDFKVYRKHKRQVVPTIMPDGV